MRPIDADALKREIVDFKVKLCPENRDYGVGYFSALSVVEGMLACAPTLTLDDLRPNGQWDPDWWRPKCSLCGFTGSLFDIPVSPFNYCPNCGAKMENGEANE